MKLPKNYFPTYHHGCNPIHAVRDWCKVRRLIRAARRGDTIPPILIDGEMRNGNMLTGTHRSAANDIMVMLGDYDHLIPIVTLDDIDVSDDLLAAIDANDYREIDYLIDQND